MIFDSFMFNDEFEILECRLTEMYDAVDYFIAVEADIDHQGHPKPYRMYDALISGQLAEWSDKIYVVKATNLPTVEEHPDPWARELAQREWVSSGLSVLGARPDDIVLHGDVDEICRPLHVRNVRPTDIRGRHPVVTFGQRGHFWAIDWRYPHTWNGTVATRYSTILEHLGETPFGNLRNMRNLSPYPPGYEDAGWHLSWLGGPERAEAKLNAFCHPEVKDRIDAAIADELSFYRDGVHVDGEKMWPVEVDDSWPDWVTAGNAPDNWYRPR